MKVQGGKAGVITRYAPHNLKPLDERRDFLCQVEGVMGENQGQRAHLHSW